MADGGLVPAEPCEARPTTGIQLGRDAGSTMQEEDEQLMAELAFGLEQNAVQDYAAQGESGENGAHPDSALEQAEASAATRGTAETGDQDSALAQRRSKKVVSIVLDESEAAIPEEGPVEIPGAVNSMEISEGEHETAKGALDSQIQAEGPQRHWTASGLRAKTTVLKIANARDGMMGKMTEVAANRPQEEEEAADVGPTLGLHWRVAEREEVLAGTGLANPELAAALQRRMSDAAPGDGHTVTLTEEDVAGLEMPEDLSKDSYILVGRSFLVPLLPPEEGKLGSDEGDAGPKGLVLFENEEEGTIIMKDEVKKQHKTLEELEAEDEKIAKKRRRGCCGIVFTPFEELPDLPVNNPCRMDTEHGIRRRCLNLAVDPALNVFWTVTTVIHFLLALPEILSNVFSCEAVAETTGVASTKLACAAEIPFFHHFIFLVRNSDPFQTVPSARPKPHTLNPKQDSL